VGSTLLISLKKNPNVSKSVIHIPINCAASSLSQKQAKSVDKAVVRFHISIFLNQKYMYNIELLKNVSRQCGFGFNTF
jgi:hypothetical protein